MKLASTVLQLAYQLLASARSALGQAMWHFWSKLLEHQLVLHYPEVTDMSQASPNMYSVESTHW